MTTQADIKNDTASAAVNALTPEQVTIIQTKARAVPQRWRQKFFSAVADQLAVTRMPTNRDVLEICAAARRALAIGIGVPTVESW